MFCIFNPFKTCQIRNLRRNYGVVHVRNAPQKSLNMIIMRDDGSMTTASLTPLESLSILPKGTKLRDLRVSQQRQISDILVREDHVFVIIEHIMAFIAPNKLILLRGESNNVQELAATISQAILNVQKNSGEPFEYLVIEEMLEQIALEFETRLALLIQVVDRILKAISTIGFSSDDAMLRLIPISRSLTTFQFSVTELLSALETLLKSDENLENICLSAGRKHDAKIETEHMLSAFTRKFEEINNEITALKSDISSTKQIIDMSLSSTRNFLLRLNLHIALTALSCSGATFICSVFGMNLLHGLEHNSHAFWIVTMTTPFFGLLFYITYATYYMNREKQLKYLSKKAVNNNFFDNINSLNYMKKIARTTNPDELRKIIEPAIGEAITDTECESLINTFSKIRYIVNREDFDRMKRQNEEHRVFIQPGQTTTCDHGHAPCDIVHPESREQQWHNPTFLGNQEDNITSNEPSLMNRKE